MERIFITKKDNIFVVTDEKTKTIITGDEIIYLDNDNEHNDNEKEECKK